MGVFQGAVDCLDTDDPVGNLHKNFALMAKSHARRSTPKISFFELRTIVLEVLTESCNLNEEQQDAWRVFFNCAINIIFGQFDQVNAAVQKH